MALVTIELRPYQFAVIEAIKRHAKDGKIVMPYPVSGHRTFLATNISSPEQPKRPFIVVPQHLKGRRK